MSKITVTTIAGATSGADANLVKIESGDTLQALSNATVGGTLIVTGATTLSSNVAVNGGTGGQVAVNYTTASTTGLKLNDTNSGNLGGFIDFRSGSGAGTQRATIQNANNAGIHVNVGTGGSLSFGTGYTAANALDDYEEGTWTATLGGLSSNPTVSAYAYNSGHYTKIGRQVFAHIYMRIENGNISGGSGDATINGLPFAAKSSGAISNGAGGWIENFTSIANSFSSGRSYARPFMVNSENRMRIYQLSYSNPTQMTGWSLTQADDGAFLIGGVMVYMTE